MSVLLIKPSWRGKTNRILKFVAWSFRLSSVFLTEDSVLDSCYECGSNLGSYSVAPSVCLRNWTLIEVLLLLAEHPLSIIQSSDVGVAIERGLGMCLTDVRPVVFPNRW